MRSVVVTGIGIVSCIGINKEEVVDSLRAARSGIVAAPEYTERGFRSQVHGAVDIDLEAHVERKWRRFMGNGTAYCYVAMREALEDAQLQQKDFDQDSETGMIIGSGGPSTLNMNEAFLALAKHKSTRRIGPFMVPRTMSSTSSAVLSTAFGIKGVSYSISSACATSAHCIGNAAELIQSGKQNMVFAGGSEELHWTMSCLFDAMAALSSGYNETPEKASRAFDRARDGFVIAGGAAVLVLEEAERALKRGAKIYAALTGYGATSDGFDMVQPSGEGAARCMRLAMKNLRNKKIDYINAHGTSTPVGDRKECEALREVFGKDIPYISSTKSLTGHSLGAAGAQEAAYTLLMMDRGFMCRSANIDELDAEFADCPILTEHCDTQLDCVMSNSFGFGGTNATLVFERT